MVTLPITLLTASVLGLMLVWLSVRVIGQRVKSESLIGDDATSDLLWSVRIHANFIEYTPLFLILLALLEYSAANQTALIVLAALFVVDRFLHAAGMGEEANLKFRQAGMVGTFLCIVAGSLDGFWLGVTLISLFPGQIFQLGFDVKSNW